jgi:hypothetical protein
VNPDTPRAPHPPGPSCALVGSLPSIYEIYLINKHTPNYNIEFNNKADLVSFSLPHIRWKKFDHIKVHTPQKKLTEKDVIEIVSDRLLLKPDGMLNKKEVSKALGLSDYTASNWLRRQTVIDKLRYLGIIVKHKYLHWDDMTPFKDVKKNVCCCETCQASFEKRSNRQKYCDLCKDDADRLKKQCRDRVYRWRKKHGLIKEPCDDIAV